MAQLGVKLNVIGLNWVKSDRKLAGPDPKMGEFFKTSRAIAQPVDWGKNVGL